MSSTCRLLLAVVIIEWTFFSNFYLFFYFIQKRDLLSDGNNIEEGRELLYPALTLLDISHNCMMSLTPDIGLFTQLSELKIAGNRLKEVKHLSKSK